MARYPYESPDTRRALCEASSLEDLLGLFGRLQDETCTELPTFGGEEPADTNEVWSWDAERLLVGTCADDLRIMPRSEWRRR